MERRGWESHRWCIPVLEFHLRICNEPLYICLFQDYSFSSVRVETPLLLVVNGKPQGSSSQAAATVASRPQCEWPSLDGMLKREWRRGEKLKGTRQLHQPDPVMQLELGGCFRWQLSFPLPCKTLCVFFLSCYVPALSGTTHVPGISPASSIALLRFRQRAWSW